MEGGQATPQGALGFPEVMIELGLFGFLVLTFVLSIYLLRRTRRSNEPLRE
jgi:hypothetical protein